MGLLLAFLLWVLSFSTYAQGVSPDVHVFPAELDRVVDADTMDVTLDMSLGMSYDVRIRVHDFDSPETWRPRNEAEALHGAAATQRAIELLSDPFWVRVIGWGVYNRVEGEIILWDGLDYGYQMTEEGYAKRDEYP